MSNGAVILGHSNKTQLNSLKKIINIFLIENFINTDTSIIQ